jgi:hypothetical protein
MAACAKSEPSLDAELATTSTASPPSTTPPKRSSTVTSSARPAVDLAPSSSQGAALASRLARRCLCSLGDRGGRALCASPVRLRCDQSLGLRACLQPGRCRWTEGSADSRARPAFGRRRRGDRCLVQGGFLGLRDAVAAATDAAVHRLQR